jgi:hypothetical protein
MVIVKENQENAQVLYIFSIYYTCMFRSVLTFIMVLVVTEFSATRNNCLSLQSTKDLLFCVTTSTLMMVTSDRNINNN